MNETAVQPIRTAWEEPPLARARPTWMEDYPESTQPFDILRTMKPLGQYPSNAEYKSVGLAPPSREALKQAQLASRAEIDDADLMTDTPITPAGEEAMFSKATSTGNDEENQPSLSSAETTGGEILSHLTFPSLPSLSPLPHHPETPLVTAAVDGMAGGPDFLAVLATLPSPASKTYDVGQLQGVVEDAIRNSSGRGDHNVALSLVHYWSRANGDDFKLSLIHNLGQKEADHSLELALRTMLRGSVEDASKWLARVLDSGGEPSLPSTNPPRVPFKVADIYRDTSGPKLEEAFANGKTNTAPLKRPKKACRANENPYKRRLEWDAEGTMGGNLQKRARLSQRSAVEPPMVHDSSLRPDRSESTDLDIAIADTAASSAPSQMTASSSRLTSTPERRQAERLQWRKEWIAKVAQQQKAPGRGRGRSQSNPLKIDWEPQSSDSEYSERENEWESSYEPRQDPNSG